MISLGHFIAEQLDDCTRRHRNAREQEVKQRQDDPLNTTKPQRSKPDQSKEPSQ